MRLLFCPFAEDTTIFEKRLFQDYIETKTSVDGSDLAHHISTIFYVLSAPENRHPSNLYGSLNAFPHVDGKLFEAMLDLCALSGRHQLAALLNKAQENA